MPEIADGEADAVMFAGSGRQGIDGAINVLGGGADGPCLAGFGKSQVVDLAGFEIAGGPELFGVGGEEGLEVPGVLSVEGEVFAVEAVFEAVGGGMALTGWGYGAA